MQVVTNKKEQEEEQVITPIKSVDQSETVLDRLTKNARDGILPARYLLKDEDGEFQEDIEGMFRRVAENIAGAESDDLAQDHWTERFYNEMSELRLMPNSPTLMNAGTDMNQLSACFVLEPEDDMEDIFYTTKDAALIFQSGGGVGYSFSDLRPKGAYINSTGGEASGPVSFMQVFDETCNQIKQGGKRRGAQMAILRVDHPDIGRFAVSKRTEGDFANFNISAGYTDEFVNAAKNGETYTLYDPATDYEDAYELREETRKFYLPCYQDNPRNAYDDGEGAIVDENIWRDHADEITTVEGLSLREKWEGYFNGADELGNAFEVGSDFELPAAFLWDIMIDGAYQNGEPGLFYLDETNREHSFDVNEYPKHEINATNPCAEQPLSEYEACNLAHVNLSLILKDDAKQFDGGSVAEYLANNIDYGSLDLTVEAGVRMLDNVVTQSNFPVDEIEQRVSGQRKIGLGIMGFAQMLYQMGIPYGSEESYQVARLIMEVIDRKGTDVSHKLAKERGSFDYWDESKYANPTEYPEWFESHTGLDPDKWADGYPIRNHNITTIAPTGTTSMLANTSGGCEPVYNVANFKNVGNDIQGDDVLVEFDDYFLETLEANDIDVDAIKSEAESLMRENEFDGVHDLSIPGDLADLFVTTQDLSSRQHGLMQRAFQEFCDSGISKTVNMPNEATREDVADAYELAFSNDELGDAIKGVTVYRDGSRQEQVLTTRMDNEIEGEDDTVAKNALDLYLSGDIDREAAVALGVEFTEGEGDSADCPEDGCDGTLEPTDDCAMCDECFASPCDS